MGTQSLEEKMHADWMSTSQANNNGTAMAIVINGISYESLNEAALKTGIGTYKLSDIHKKLKKTSLSEIETEVSVKKTFIFKLPRS